MKADFATLVFVFMAALLVRATLDGSVVSGWLPIQAIPQMAALDGLRLARPAAAVAEIARTRTGVGHPRVSCHDSGFEGRTVMGPTCGNEGEGQPCEDQPFGGVFEVLNREGRRMTTFHSDADGYFRVVIPPGTYLVAPLEAIPLPNLRKQRSEVTVTAGQFTRVTLVFQTGIQ